MTSRYLRTGTLRPDRLLPGIGSETWSVAALAETPAGQILLAVEDDSAGSLHVSELRLGEGPGRRRAVRH